MAVSLLRGDALMMSQQQQMIYQQLKLKQLLLLQLIIQLHLQLVNLKN